MDTINTSAPGLEAVSFMFRNFLFYKIVQVSAADKKLTAKKKRRQGKSERQRIQLQELQKQLSEKDCKIEDLQTKLKSIEDLNTNLNVQVAESEVKIACLLEQNLMLKLNVSW